MNKKALGLAPEGCKIGHYKALKTPWEKAAHDLPRPQALAGPCRTSPQVGVLNPGQGSLALKGRPPMTPVAERPA
jgi:hypothetical protein